MRGNSFLTITRHTLHLLIERDVRFGASSLIPILYFFRVFLLLDYPPTVRLAIGTMFDVTNWLLLLFNYVHQIFNQEGVIFLVVL